MRKVKAVVEFALRAIGLALLVGGLGLIVAFFLNESLVDLGNLFYENKQPTLSSSQFLWMWIFYPVILVMFIMHEGEGVIVTIAKGMIVLGVLATVWVFFTDGHEALLLLTAAMTSILASVVLLHWINIRLEGKMAILMGSIAFIAFLFFPLIFIVTLLNTGMSPDGLICYQMLQSTLVGLINRLTLAGLIVKGIIQPYWRKFRQRFPYIGLKMFTDKNLDRHLLFPVETELKFPTE